MDIHFRRIPTVRDLKNYPIYILKPRKKTDKKQFSNYIVGMTFDQKKELSSAHELKQDREIIGKKRKRQKKKEIEEKEIWEKNIVERIKEKTGKDYTKIFKKIRKKSTISKESLKPKEKLESETIKSPYYKPEDFGEEWPEDKYKIKRIKGLGIYSGEHEIPEEIEKEPIGENIENIEFNHDPGQYEPEGIDDGEIKLDQAMYRQMQVIEDQEREKANEYVEEMKKIKEKQKEERKLKKIKEREKDKMEAALYVVRTSRIIKANRPSLGPYGKENFIKLKIDEKRGPIKKFTIKP
jgi:hypothetical protein